MMSQIRPNLSATRIFLGRGEAIIPFGGILGGNVGGLFLRCGGTMCLILTSAGRFFVWEANDREVVFETHSKMDHFCQIDRAISPRRALGYGPVGFSERGAKI